MGKSVAANTPTVAFEPTIVAERIIGFLQAKHPWNTAKLVGADTGISPKTIAKWMERGSVPNGAHIGLLGFAYGVEFLAVAYPAIGGLVAAARAAECEILTEQLDAARAELDALQEHLRESL